MVELVSSLWYGWIWLAAAALGIVTVLVGLVYVLSGLLMNEKMKTWAKMELAEIFYSAVIIAVVMGGGITLMDSVVQGALGVNNNGGAPPGTAAAVPCYSQGATYAYVPVSVNGAVQYQCLDICGAPIASDEFSVYSNISSCHIKLGIWYLRETFDEAKTFAYSIYISYIKTSMAAAFTINIEYFTEYAGFFTFNPWAGFFTMGNTVKQMCFDWAMKIMMLTKFQEVLLRFIAVALFPALFVIGAILRTFTFTRKLGGLLLATAISLYFIFPAFYAFGALVMLDMKSQYYNTWMSSPANPSVLTAETAENPTGQILDPPIANTMYINDTLTMIGGQGGTTAITSQEMQNDLLQDEGQDEYGGTQANNFMNSMAAGNGVNGQLMPQFDVTPATPNTYTPAQEQSALQNSYQSVSDWKDTMSTQGKYDTFLNSVWEPDGPLDALARLTFWSMFFGLFSIIGTIGVIRSLSITFGGDIEIAGLTRLI
jgi:hypothetical protein